MLDKKAIVINNHIMTDGTNRYGTGGIIGDGGSSKINNSKSYGQIKGECAAGIVARGPSTINKCYVAAKIEGSKYSAGIVARPECRDTRIYNCIVAREAEITSEQYAGGIYGQVSNYGGMYIYNSCVLGKIKAPTVAGISIKGGHYWNKIASVINCYFAGTMEGDYVSGIQANMIYSNIENIEFQNNYYSDEISSAVYGVNDNELTGVNKISIEFMKAGTNGEGKTFLELLNNYIAQYNVDENNNTKLVEWIYDSETGYPVPDIIN